jgi:hypothetical protein
MLIERSMRSFFRFILKVIAVAGILVIVGLILIIILILVTKFWDSQLQAQQLAALDQQFTGARNSIPLEYIGVTLLPEQVGGFRRGDVDVGLSDVCGKWRIRNDDLCFSGIYASSTIENGTWLTVWAYVWRKTVQGVQAIEDLVGLYACGADLDSEIVLRTEANYPYGYHVCFGFFGTPSLRGVVWQNSDWFIGVRGKYEAFSQFIADYPY